MMKESYEVQNSDVVRLVGNGAWHASRDAAPHADETGLAALKASATASTEAAGAAAYLAVLDSPAACAQPLRAVAYSNITAAGQAGLLKAGSPSQQQTQPVPGACQALPLAAGSVLTAPRTHLQPGSPLAHAAAGAEAWGGGFGGSSSNGHSSRTAAAWTSRSGAGAVKGLAKSAPGMQGLLTQPGTAGWSLDGLQTVTQTLQRSHQAPGVQQQQQQTARQPACNTPKDGRACSGSGSSSSGGGSKCLAQSTGCTQQQQPQQHHACASAASRPSSAFTGPSREQAGRTTRASLVSPNISSSSSSSRTEAPGPGHFQPQHASQDKHVRGVKLGPADSSRRAAAAAERQIALAAAAAAASRAGMVAQQQQQAGSRSSTHQQQQVQEQLQEQRLASQAQPHHRISTTAPPAAAGGEAVGWRRSTAMGSLRLSAADREVDTRGPASRQGIQQQQQQQQQQRPSPAFLSIGRDHPAAAGSCGAAEGSGSGSSSSSFKEGYDHLTRPGSRGPVAEFSKQTSRAPPQCTGDCPAALGPGAYFRKGDLPVSLTGKGVAAGHPGAVAAACGSGWPHSRPATAGPGAAGQWGSRPQSGARGNKGQQQRLCDTAAGTGAIGLWAWEAAAYCSCSCPCVGGGDEGASCSCGTISRLDCRVADEQPLSPPPQPPTAAQHQSKSRPPSAALEYLRSGRATVLVPPSGTVLPPSQAPPAAAAAAIGDGTATSLAAAASCSHGCTSRHQEAGGAQQQLQGWASGQPTGVPARPASAAALLTGAAAAAHRSSQAPAARCMTAQHRPIRRLASAGKSTAAASAAQRASATARDAATLTPAGAGAGLQERYSSTGLAVRVKGGRFSQSSREAAAAGAGGGSLTELTYDPNPEVQGHVRRAPGWSLPPNRVATSKKWALAAARAALQ